METWLKLHAAYDDEALVQLASEGLVRRAAKELEAGAIAWEARTAESGLLRVSGQRVRLDPKGLGAGTCDCPAPGLCKHLLAATLWVRGQAGEEPSPVSGEVALQEILALDLEALLKEAGKAQERKAMEWLVSEEAPACEVQGGTLRIHFPATEHPCRYLAGGGLGGMVSEAPASRRTAVHLAALLAVRRLHGMPWRRQETPQESPQVDQAFLGTVRDALLELVAGGLSHVSEITDGRLSALAMSSRGEDQPRLASALRGLAGSVSRLARRDPQVDERRVLLDTARCFALVEVLQRGTETWAADFTRRAYVPGKVVTALPLGVHWWETPGGARGLTLGLWDLEAGHLLTAALARPGGHDPQFSRRTVWDVLPMLGNQPASRLCSGVLTLANPRLSADGRVATGEQEVTVGGPLAAADPRAATLGIDDWTVVLAGLREAAGLRGGGQGMILLKVSQVGEATFDEIAQILTWPVADRKGRWMPLHIPHDDLRESRILSLNQCLEGKCPIHSVLVSVLRSGGRTRLEPVSLLVATGGQLLPLSLDYQEITLKAGSWLGRLVARLKMDGNRPLAPPEKVSPAHRLLETLLGAVESMTDMGRFALGAEQSARLQEAQRQCQALGLDRLVEPIRHLAGQPGPEACLRLAYLTQLALALEGLPEAAGDGSRRGME